MLIVDLIIIQVDSKIIYDIEFAMFMKYIEKKNNLEVLPYILSPLFAMIIKKYNPRDKNLQKILTIKKIKDKLLEISKFLDDLHYDIILKQGKISSHTIIEIIINFVYYLSLDKPLFFKEKKKIKKLKNRPNRSIDKNEINTFNSNTFSSSDSVEKLDNQDSCLHMQQAKAIVQEHIINEIMKSGISKKRNNSVNKYNKDEINKEIQEEKEINI